jgi:hypothetical protein
MQLDDPRINYVTEVLGIDKEDISQSDYNRLEDNFTSLAEDCALTDIELVELADAGFTIFAEKIKALKHAAHAFNWGKENL